MASTVPLGRKKKLNTGAWPDTLGGADGGLPPRLLFTPGCTTFLGSSVRSHCLQREGLINRLVLSAREDLVGDSHFLRFKDEEIDPVRD